MTAAHDRSLFRQARTDDLPGLYALNKLADDNGRLAQADIRRCLKDYPSGQWVIEDEGRVVGAVYSRRVASVEALLGSPTGTVAQAHEVDGEVVQVLAWAVEAAAPAEVARQLLEHALAAYRATAGVARVVAIAPFEASSLPEAPVDEAALWNAVGDALEVYRSLGARVLQPMSGYRTRANRPPGGAVLLDLTVPVPAGSAGPHLFVLSAANAERLRAYAEKVLAWLHNGVPDGTFHDAIYTWQIGRTPMKRRLAIEVRDEAELRERLQLWLAGTPATPGTWSSEAATPTDDADVADAPAGLAKVAADWVAGGDAAWQDLHASAVPAPRRIAVPTYPFGGTRHWLIPDSAPVPLQARPTPAEPTEPAIEPITLRLAPTWETQPVPTAGRGLAHRVVLVCGFESLALDAFDSVMPGVQVRRLPTPAVDDGAAYTGMVQATLDAVREAWQARGDRCVLLQVLVEDSADAWMAGGLSGLLRTASEEYGDCHGQLIFTDALSAQELARHLDAEAHHGNTAIVRYRQGVRQRRSWRAADRAPADRVVLREGGVYCITGGLGGLGTRVAAELLRRGQGAKVILLGRSALKGGAQQRFQALQALAASRPGASVDYRPLDIADAEAVRSTLDDIVRTHGHLHGIVHAAGVLDDGRIASKSAEGVRAVLAPKLAGTLHLDAASRGLGLDFFVLFASLAGVIGNDGQADYAAANAFQDWFAEARHLRVAAGQCSGRTLAIDWPLWQEGGMRLSPERLEALTQSTGLLPLRTEMGLDVFFDSLADATGQLLVLEGDAARMQTWLAQALHPLRPLASDAPVASTVTATLREATQRQLAQLFATASERSTEQIDPNDPMENYGLDSIIINRLNLSLAGVFPGLPKTLFFENRTLAAVSDYLLARQIEQCRSWTGHAIAEPTASPSVAPTLPVLPASIAAVFAQETRRIEAASREQAREDVSREPIAIIGVSGVYPQAPNLDAYWRNLREGRDCIGEIPAERWSIDGFYEPDVDRALERGKSYSRWGGFLDGFADFDPLFFNISPREAMNLDPQERLFLQESWRALESAGYTREDLKSRFGGRVGVFAGITKAGYQLYALHPTRDGEPFLPYTSFGSTANRVSYFLDLAGPSMPVDTMCSSSLAAIHEACEHILRGECDMAFAGGVNLYLHPHTYAWLCSHNMLSRDGRCRSFGAGGDGFVPGEGVGVVLLKRLSAAERDGDPIHGVILASRINHGGRTHGYTVPNPNAQAALIRSAIDAAGIDARAISYIETHGTGTELGDPIEIAGLQHAFGVAADSGYRCRIGAVKSNIGHLEAAAGIAGLIKVLLQMRHGQLAPSLHAGTLNPNIDWRNGVFEVNTDLRDWSSAQPGQPRIAGLSSFGASGTNAHLIVQEYVPGPGRASATEPTVRDEPVLVPLSARTAPQLAQRARDLLAYLRDAATAPNLDALAHTLQVGREAMEERLCCVVQSTAQLTQALQAFLDGATDCDGQLHVGQVASDRNAVAGMARDEDFRDTVERWIARRKLERLAEWWVRGLEIDWRALQGEIVPVRLDLPTYPFARDRLWVDTRVLPAPAATPKVTALHPLVHANVSDLHRQAYASVLDGSEPCLRDHVVGGDKVLPGVAYLEMVRTAMSLALPDASAQVLELHNTVWVQPLVVDGPHPIEIVLQPDAGSERIGFTVASTPSSQGGNEATDDARIVHCQGEAVFVTETGSDALDVDALQARMDRGLVDVDAVYRQFAEAGVAFGPAHRALRSVALGTGEVLARLRLPQAVSPVGPDYVLHPSLLDSALQACSCLTPAALSERGAPLLPFAVDTVRVLAACRDEMIAWVRRAPSGSDHPDAPLHFDVDLLDADGRACVQLRGFSARPRAGRRNETHTHALVPVWNRLAPAPGADPATQRLVVAGGAHALRWAQRTLAQAEALPAELDGDALGLFLSDVDHVLWVAPDAFDPEQNTDVEPANALAGLRDVFRLVKAALPLARPPRWTFVTRNTQAVSAADRIAPCHAGVAGFVGSLSREYPDWDIRLLDIDTSDAVGADMCTGLAGEGPVSCLAHRDGEWFVRGLASLETVPAANAAYREGGTYVVVGGAGGIGMAWSRFMIERFDARLIWIGRRAADAEIAAKIAELSRLGPAPLYLQADATDRASLQRAAEQIRAVHPAVHGVVHSAIDLRDMSLAQMDAVELERAFVAKMAVAVHLDAVFGSQDLDFALFFSSLISFTTGAGQANYAAGSTFADSFALALAQRRPYPAKVMNWGYWGGVGVVADAFHQTRMRDMGIGSIDADEAMTALQSLVDQPGLAQMAVLKTLETQVIATIAVPERVGGRRRTAPSLLPEAVNDARASHVVPDEQRLREDALGEDVDALAVDMVISALSNLGIAAIDAPDAAIARIHPAHARWLRTSLQLARACGRAPRDRDELWREWESRRVAWLANPGCRAQIQLLESCLRALPQILSGDRAATDVIFPNASMAHVQGVYEGNALADGCNDAVGELLVAWLDRQPSARSLRILEIGAGTGGTTKNLLPRLTRFGDRIEEYCYTDVSKAFLIHAETQFRTLCPGLRPAIFDVSRAPAQQGLETGRYDAVIATNVLHATPDIRRTLRHAKALLRPGGIVVINEMTGWSLVRHLTFGLLEGWWLYEDEALREPGSPGLALDTWQRLLAGEGFEDVSLVMPEAHAFGQLVVSGASDGLWRQRMAPATATAATPGSTVAVVAAAPVAARRVAPATATAAAAAQAAGGSLRERCIAHLKQAVAGVLRLDEARVGLKQPLADYGLDSILVIGLTHQLRKAFPEIRSTIFFEARNLSDLADTLLRAYPESAQRLFGQPEVAAVQPDSEPVAAAAPARPLRLAAPAAAPSSVAAAAMAETPSGRAAPFGTVPFDVAIIGLSGRYPMANDLDTFWANLAQGRHCVSEIPADRWNWRDFHGDDPTAPGSGSIYTRWGGFLDRIDQFDPLFFRISPKDAKAIDPQERLFLQACYHAIEDAGYRPDTLARPEKVGVFVGAMNARYTAQPLHYSIANRVSFALDFQGPSVAVDTACSSSLTAIHFALESLYSGGSECAIAGGVSLIIDAGHYRELTAVGMLSHDDRCRAFGAGADGFVDAEGVGAVVLKPLAQAERDGDLIHGVIRGSAINAGGRTHGYTVPNPVAQAAVVSEALRRARVAAGDVSCIEAHGTGTALGDPIEVAGLCRAFEADTRERGFCAIGSLKSNFGHCESAAGIAALTKVLLQLRHGQLAPTLHAEQVNAEIDFAQTPFRLQRTLQAWDRPVRAVDGAAQEVPRIAGISSFGAGGANAHLIVQEYVPSAARRVSADASSHAPVVVPLSARTAEQLARRVDDLLGFLDQANARGEAVSLPSLAYTLQVAREERDERLACVAASPDALVAALRAVQAQAAHPDVQRGRVRRDGPVAVEDIAFEAATPAQLAQAWVAGAAVDWTRAYAAGAQPARLRLPGYPFAQESYWQPVARTAPGPARPAALHPLLHRNVSSLAGTAYEAVFEPTDRMASDHRLEVGVFRGRVVPAAVHLEMVRAALADAVDAAVAGAQAIELSETTWAMPAAFGHTLTLRVALLPRADGAVVYEIGSPAPEWQGSVLCQGIARWVQADEPARLDLAALSARMQVADWDGDAFYRGQTASGLAYGPSYRSLAGLRLGTGEMLAELRLPEDDAEPVDPSLALHPVLLDGAMQAASLLLPIAAPPSLPWRLASLRRYRACTPRMFAWVRHSVTGAMPGLDIDLCDEAGNVCAQLRGLNHGALDVADLSSDADVQRPAIEDVAPTLSALETAAPRAGSATADTQGKRVALAPLEVAVATPPAPMPGTDDKPVALAPLDLAMTATPASTPRTDGTPVALASLDNADGGEPATAKPRIQLSFTS